MDKNKKQKNHKIALLLSGFSTGASFAAFLYSAQNAVAPINTDNQTSWIVVAIFGALVAIGSFVSLFSLWVSVNDNNNDDDESGGKWIPAF